MENQERLLDLVFDFDRDVAKHKVTIDKSTIESIPRLSTTPRDIFPAKQFLNGKNCLTGGSGWWKYEFCFGRRVRQIHYEKNLEVVSVNLGDFDGEAHLEWIKANPDKKPKPKETRTEVSHFYQGGDVCTMTNEKRKTEVKLKCNKSGGSSTAVVMYLLEPRTCEYILVVEAAVICDILPHVDEETGLVPPDIFPSEDLNAIKY